MIMPIRMLDAAASDFVEMDADGLATCIRQAAGRTIAVEVMSSTAPPIEGITHGELAAAMGADIIVLDGYDVLNPTISEAPDDVIQDAAPLNAYKRLLGRPVGINMIVADPAASSDLGGRLVSESTVERAVTQGADILFLYSRPHLGGTLALMQQAAHQIAEMCGEKVLLIGVPSFSMPAPRTPAAVEAYLQHARALLEAGCRGIGLPMPGSMKGWLFDQTCQIIDGIQQDEGLAWLFVTGSVEGASQDAMVQLALAAKQLGADAYRLDEAGLSGMPIPENILTFSINIRGRRHTYRRMAISIRR